MLKILTEYNLHWQGEKAALTLLPRPTYLEQVMQLLPLREIIVITGIRRSGKSSLVKLIIDHLLNTGVPGRNIFYLNMEDYRLGTEKDIQLLDDLFEKYRKHVTPEGRQYVMLDEIQEVPRFEKWLRTIYETNTNVKFIITGSSSTLTSTELASLLTGRQVSIEIYPFSFVEYLQYKNKKLANEIDELSIESLYLSSTFASVEELLNSYLIQGGFPEIVKSASQATNMLLLQQYVDDILLKDITRRYNVRKVQSLQKLTHFLISNIGNEINIKRSAELLGINRSTVLDLISYLKGVYLIQMTSNFSFSLNERLNTTKPKKVYCIDNGFFSALKQTQSPDLGKRVENLVFQQLKFIWREQVFYWRSKVEIDFVLENGYPINVTIDDDLREPEVTGLFYYLNQFNLDQGLLISWNKSDTIRQNGKNIVVIPLWLFLLKSKKE